MKGKKFIWKSPITGMETEGIVWDCDYIIRKTDLLDKGHKEFYIRSTNGISYPINEHLKILE